MNCQHMKKKKIDSKCCLGFVTPFLLPPTAFYICFSKHKIHQLCLIHVGEITWLEQNVFQ